MNQMEIFKNPEFGSVRVIEENGKYLFCGVDVAKALGYTKPQNATIILWPSRLCSSRKW